MKRRQLSEADLKKLGQKINRGFDFLKQGLETKELTKDKVLALLQDLLHSLYNTGKITKQQVLNITRDLPSQKPRPNQQQSMAERKFTNEDVRELYELLTILKEIREEEEKTPAEDPKDVEAKEEEPKEEEPKEEPKDEEPKEEEPESSELVSALFKTTAGKNFKRLVGNISNQEEKAEVIIDLIKELPKADSQTLSNKLRRYFSN
jgi:hypothetical protein